MPTNCEYINQSEKLDEATMSYHEGSAECLPPRVFYAIKHGQGTLCGLTMTINR